MRSRSRTGQADRQRAEEQFKKKRVDSETEATISARQAEAEKTTRLRALRLTKEAADKETANRDAAAKAARFAPHPRVPEPRASGRSEPK